MTKLLVTVGVSIFFILDLFSFGFTQETLSVTTYYPSPVGSYRELRANRVAVDPNRAMPATDGTLVWGPGRGVLSTDQGASIELGSQGTPFINFSNDLTGQFDAGLVLAENDIFKIQVGNSAQAGTMTGNKIEVKNRENTGHRDLYIKTLYYHLPSGKEGNFNKNNLQIVQP